jgi:hypothetical protein
MLALDQHGTETERVAHWQLISVMQHVADRSYSRGLDSRSRGCTEALEQQRGLIYVRCEFHSEQKDHFDERTEGTVLEQGEAGSRRAYWVDGCYCRGAVHGESNACAISCTMPIVGSFSFSMVAIPVTD